MNHNIHRGATIAPPKRDSKQIQDMLHRTNFNEKIKIYNQLDKKILIKLLSEMEEHYRKLSELRNTELKEFAERISKLQDEISELQKQISGEKLDG